MCPNRLQDPRSFHRCHRCNSEGAGLFAKAAVSFIYFLPSSVLFHSFICSYQQKPCKMSALGSNASRLIFIEGFCSFLSQLLLHRLPLQQVLPHLSCMCIPIQILYIFYCISISLSLLLHLFSLFWYNHSDQLPKFETKAGAQQPQQLTSEFSIVFSCASGGSILRPCETGRLLFCRQFSESL